MQPAELRAAVAALIQRTVLDRGLPVKVDDPATLARVAAILRPMAPSSRPLRKRRSHDEAA